MPPWMCVIICTLAVLGLAFIIVLAVCINDGWATWKRWRKFSRVLYELDSIIITAKKQAESREQNVDNNVAHAHEVPFPPCDHHECPRKSARG